MVFQTLESNGRETILADMKKIGVIVNTKRPRAPQVLDELRQLAEKHRFALYAEDAVMAKALGAELIPVAAFGKKVDLVLALGATAQCCIPRAHCMDRMCRSWGSTSAASAS